MTATGGSGSTIGRMSRPRRSHGALAVLVLLAARAASPSDAPPLRFAWPVPSHVRVTERIERKGQEAVLRYQASLVPGAGDRLELRLSGIEFVRSPLAAAAPAASAVESLVDTLQPTLVISREGLLEDVVGFERAIDAGLALARNTLKDPEAAKRVESFFRSPPVTAAMKSKSGEYWELWVGVWAGAELRPGDDVTVDLPIPMPDGSSVKQRTRVRHLGPDPQTKGHVRLSLEGTLEGSEFAGAMARVVGALIPEARRSQAQPADTLVAARRDTRLSVVTEAATLRPREARSEVTITITVKGGEKHTRIDRRDYRFDWSPGGARQSRRARAVVGSRTTRTDKEPHVSTNGTRSLQVTWEDPAPAAREARQMSGLEYLRSIAAGRFPAPPIARLLGYALVEVDEGRAVFEVTPGEKHYNPIGLVHGGLLATVLDSAMGCAIHSVLPAGIGYSTLEIKVNYTRPALVGTGLLRCEARIVHRGKQTATAEGAVRDAQGRVYAHGTTTCLIMGGGASAPAAGNRS